MKKILALVLCMSMLVLGACSNSSSTSGEGDKKASKDKLQVVTTYSILYDMARNVGGDKVEIHSFVPIGANPHEYEPLPKDVMKTTDADVVLYNGLNLEEGNSWFKKLLTSAKKDGKDAPVYLASEGVEPVHLETKGLEKEPDPHAWLDIENGIKYVENIKKAFIKEDPKNEKYYTENAEKYIAELKALHDETVEKMKQIPEEKRFLISSEGAFKYFGKAYDIETGYIWEINSENQGTPEQIRAVVDLIKEKQIPALFVETSVDKRSMETVSNETGVPIAGTIFTDSLAKEGEEGDTYLEMMQWNTKTIIEGLSK